MSGFTFLRLQEIAAEKNLKKKSELLKQLVKHDDVDKLLVGNFIQRQIQGSDSPVWIEFCKKIDQWLEQRKKLESGWIINEKKFFDCIESALPLEKKLQILNGLKHHVRRGNKKIINWIVEASMDSSSQYFDFACEMADYLLSTDFFSHDKETGDVENWTEFNAFYRGDFIQKLHWLSHVEEDEKIAELMLEWSDNIILSETNPFVMARFLKVYPGAYLDAGKDPLTLIEIVHNFLEWPFALVRVRVLQAFQIILDRIPESESKIKDHIQKLLTEEKDGRVRILAQAVIGDEAQDSDASEEDDLEVEELEWEEEPVILEEGIKALLHEADKRGIPRKTAWKILTAALVLLIVLFISGVLWMSKDPFEPKIQILKSAVEKVKTPVDIISLAWNLHHREPRFSVSVDTPLSLVYVEEMHDLLDKVLERNGSLGQVLLLQVFYQNTPELFTDAHMRKVEDAISNYYDELDLRLPDGTVTVDENTLEQLQSDEKLFFLQGLITANLIPQRYAGEISLLWSDGKEQMRAKFDNGKPHGKLEVYSPQQKLILQETYLGGLPEGQSTLFYTSGQVAEQKAYSNGKPQGPVRQYYSDGLLKAEYYYEDGELNGSYKEYGRNGELILEQNYVYGLPIQNQGESE